MKIGRKTVRLAALVLTALLFVLSVGVICHAGGKQLRRDEMTREYNALASPYIEENTRLLRQINQLKARVETIERVGKRMTVTIFTQCDTNLYERCYPIAKRFDTACVFVISGERMVGREGCITLAQYDELLAEGWTAAIALPLDGEAAQRDLEVLKRAFEDLDRPFPDAVYLTAEQFTEENNEYLKAKGFKTFLHEYQDEYYEGFEPWMEHSDDPVYIPYLYLAQNKKVFPEYERITSEGGCCALATRKAVYPNEFEDTGFADSMLDLGISVLGNVFEVTVAEFGYQRSVEEYRAETYASFVELAKEKEQLKGQIADLQTERRRLSGKIVEIFSTQLDIG